MRASVQDHPIFALFRGQNAQARPLSCSYFASWCDALPLSPLSARIEARPVGDALSARGIGIARMKGERSEGEAVLIAAVPRRSVFSMRRRL